jgi:hypothetical protein
MRSWPICSGPPRPERHSRSLLRSVLVLMAAALGCTTHLTPKGFELEDSWPRVATAGEVAVRAGAAPPGRHVLKVAGSGYTVDYAEFTASVVDRMRETFTEQGVERLLAGATSYQVGIPPTENRRLPRRTIGPKKPR